MHHGTIWRLCVVAILSLMAIVSVAAQEFIVLANDKGVQKSSFARDEGIQVLITLPYPANVEVWLHNPPGTAGPSPTLFIPATPVPANILTQLGPRWLDERAPCGKYRLEIRILNPPQPLSPRTEYRYFDYATNEPPCTLVPPPPPPPPPPTPDFILLITIAGISLAVVAASVIGLLLSRWRAPPPKERVVTPPISPPPVSPTPAPPSAPPKGPHRRTPIVRGLEKEEE